MIQKILVALLLLAFVGHSLHLFEEHDNTGIFNGAIIRLVSPYGDIAMACSNCTTVKNGF